MTSLKKNALKTDVFGVVDRVHTSFLESPGFESTCFKAKWCSHVSVLIKSTLQPVTRPVKKLGTKKEGASVAICLAFGTLRTKEEGTIHSVESSQMGPSGKQIKMFSIPHKLFPCPKSPWFCPTSSAWGVLFFFEFPCNQPEHLRWFPAKATMPG